MATERQTYAVFINEAPTPEYMHICHFPLMTEDS